MRWNQIQSQTCSIARTLSVIGDRWTLLIIRDAFLRIRKFQDFQKDLGLSRHSLSDRLKQLVDAGVFEKVEYQSNPPRFEYRLSEKGIELYPILMTMAKWGNDWMDEGKGAPVIYRHQDCGQVFEPTLSCSECKETVDARSVSPEIGPGMVVDVNEA